MLLKRIFFIPVLLLLSAVAVATSFTATKAESIILPATTTMNISGWWPDGCVPDFTTSVDANADGGVSVQLIGSRDANQICTTALVKYEEMVEVPAMATSYNVSRTVVSTSPAPCSDSDSTAFCSYTQSGDSMTITFSGIHNNGCVPDIINTTINEMGDVVAYPTHTMDALMMICTEAETPYTISTVITLPSTDPVSVYSGTTTSQETISCPETDGNEESFPICEYNIDGVTPDPLPPTSLSTMDVFGWWPDGCVPDFDISAAVDANGVAQIYLVGQRDAGEICTLAVVEYQETVALPAEATSYNVTRIITTNHYSDCVDDEFFSCSYTQSENEVTVTFSGESSTSCIPDLFTSSLNDAGDVIVQLGSSSDDQFENCLQVITPYTLTTTITTPPSTDPAMVKILNQGVDEISCPETDGDMESFTYCEYQIHEINDVPPAPEPSPLDVNCDNVWNLLDVILMKQFNAYMLDGHNPTIASIAPNIADSYRMTDCDATQSDARNFKTCDLNGDGSCGLVDTVVIQQCNAFLDNEYCEMIR